MCLTAASVCTRILRFKTLLFCTFCTQNECEVSAKQNPNLCIQQIPWNSQGPPISCWRPSARLPFLPSSSRKAFISSRQDPPDHSVSPHLERLQGPQSCTFNTSWQKPSKLENQQQLARERRDHCCLCSASVRVWKHWKPPPGVKRAELVWSLFIYPSFNLTSMFEMRPVMLLSAVVLWLKWEKPIYLFLSPRQWPFFCVQMLQCVDNIPVGFGGGLSQCWWHFDPPSPGLKLTSRVAFRVFCCLAEEPLCRPSDSCSGSWIINPLTLPPQEPTFVFIVCVLIDWGYSNEWRHQRAAHPSVCTFFGSTNFLRTRPLPCSGLTSPLNNSAASLFESLGRVSGGRH